MPTLRGAFLSSRGHDIPPEQRKVIATVVEASIAGELRVKRHVMRPN
ncbi:MAG: hypothetical protein H6940_06160 [Burkholderiales bacterium]|nr:hypothetical protein [Burkholderiales bacterium]